MFAHSWNLHTDSEVQCLNVVCVIFFSFLLGLLFLIGATMTPSRRRWLRRGFRTFTVATQPRWRSRRGAAWRASTGWGSAPPPSTAFGKTPGGGTPTSPKWSPCSATPSTRSSLTPQPTCSTCATRMIKSRRTWGTSKGSPSWWAYSIIQSQRSIVKPVGLSETSPMGRIMKTRWL